MALIVPEYERRSAAAGAIPKFKGVMADLRAIERRENMMRFGRVQLWNMTSYLCAS
jgi:hypothetical protein